MTRPSARQRALVRSYVEANMTAQVQIFRGARGTFDETTGLHAGQPSSDPIYEGKARVRQISGAGTLNLVEAEIDTATTVISIPWGSPIPRRDDLVLVADDSLADDEPGGKWFRVLDIESGGLFGEARRMQCVVWRDSVEWSRR